MNFGGDIYGSCDQETIEPLPIFRLEKKFEQSGLLGDVKLFQKYLLRNHTTGEHKFEWKEVTDEQD